MAVIKHEQQPDSPPITVIQAPSGWLMPNLGELWRYRGVILNMVSRNFRVKYRQTIGGPLYAVYEPLMSMVGYSILLGGLAGMPTDGGTGYPVFTFSALTVWTLFTSGVRNASTSLFSNSALVTKIYIPRLAFPITAVSMALVDFLLTLGVLILLMLFTGEPFSPNIILMPVFALLALTLALGIGLWFAALHARFRDTTYGIGLITRGLFFLTPVVYSSTVLPAPWDELYKLNPMATIVEGYRWTLLTGVSAPTVNSVLVAAVVSVMVLISGAFVFRRLELTIADVV
jgi:lipopolysaccharide transport system permease protein